jgi:hypothetical protein
MYGSGAPGTAGKQVPGAMPAFPDEREIPTKVVSSTSRMQFTCGIKEVPLSGRTDVKALKTLVSKVAPTRLIVLRASAEDRAALHAHARALGVDVMGGSEVTGSLAEPNTGKNSATVSFRVLADRLRAQLPTSLLPGTGRTVRGSGSSAGATGSSESGCKVSMLVGPVKELAVSTVAGLRTVRLQPQIDRAKEAKDVAMDGTADEDDADQEIGASSEGERTQILLEDFSPLDIGKSLSQSLSVGEVPLNSIKQQMETRGLGVDFRIGTEGGALVCGSQVIVKKEGDNDFVIEGPPVKAFYDARKALYDHFAFV